MANGLEFKDYLPDLAAPPGDTLKEVIDSLGMPQVELAKRMGRPIKTINEIINGKATITAETALQLEKVLNVPAQFWTNLEMFYQTTKARIEAEVELAEQTYLIDRYPYAEMANWGWVKQTRVKIEKVRELLNFFGVVSLYKNELNIEANYRAITKNKPSRESLTAWLRQGERLAAKIPTAAFNESEFRKAFDTIRGITLEKSFSEKLRAICAEYGVAVVYVPHLQKTYVNGATRWIGPEKALIQLSIRNRYSDIFWFTFFHEVGHILLHGKRERFIDFEDTDKSEKESEANDFASNILIPANVFKPFAEAGNFSAVAIRSFADKIGISPAIIVGRLQHESLIPHSLHNKLRMKLVWADD